MTDVLATFAGPQGRDTGPVLLDSGASETLIPLPLASRLGLKPYTTTPVMTAAGLRHFPTAMVRVESAGRSAEVPAYITPPESQLALGASGARALGYRITAPDGSQLALSAQGQAMAARGLPMESLQVARLTECYLCSHRVDSPVFGPACMACGGCRLVSKTASPAATCPRGKW